MYLHVFWWRHGGGVAAMTTAPLPSGSRALRLAMGPEGRLPLQCVSSWGQPAVDHGARHASAVQWEAVAASLEKSSLVAPGPHASNKRQQLARAPTTGATERQQPA